MTDARRILLAAADLIEPPGRWTQGAEARDADGEDADSLLASSGPPVCWCALGALWHVARPRDSTQPRRAAHVTFDAAVVALQSVTGEPVVPWNDTKGRTQEEVVRALRRAAVRLAEAGA